MGTGGISACSSLGSLDSEQSNKADGRWVLLSFVPLFIWLFP